MRRHESCGKEDRTTDPWNQDFTLVRRCIAGDQAAWQELVDRYSPNVFSLCLATGLRPSDAEDVCQEVLLSAMRSLGSYRDCRLSTWLYRITRRRIADHFRAPDRRELASGFPGDPTFPDARPRVDGASATRADALEGERLRRTIADMADPVRSILLAYYVGEVPVREIAIDLEMPENTIKSHLRRGRMLLRAQLEKQP